MAGIIAYATASVKRALVINFTIDFPAVKKTAPLE